MHVRFIPFNEFGKPHCRLDRHRGFDFVLYSDWESEAESGPRSPLGNVFRRRAGHIHGGFVIDRTNWGASARRVQTSEVPKTSEV